MKKSIFILMMALLALLLTMVSCTEATLEETNESDPSESSGFVGETEEDETNKETVESGADESEITTVHQHVFVEHEAKAPTCSEIGWDAYVTCADCDYSTYVEKPAVDHVEKAAVEENVVAADCENVGSYDAVVYCANCDCELNRIHMEIPANGHSETVDRAVAPTCTEKGLTAGAHCSVCDKILIEQTEIDALEHSFIDRKCQTCGVVVVSEGLEYTLNEDKNGYILTSVGECADKDVIIHSLYNELPVIGIGDSAFENCSWLVSVDIPDNVTSIGINAFYKCKNLKAVIFGENSKLTTISENAFLACGGIKEITLPDSVTSIGDQAFSGCSSLYRVVFGENSRLESIGACAFHMCLYLRHINIPDSVTSIGRYAFLDCGQLLFNENGSAYYLGNEKNPYIYLHHGVSKVTHCEIPDTTKFIESSAFAYNKDLVNVVFGENSQLVRIGDRAFECCVSLISINIPDSITKIEDTTFNECSGLEIVVFGENSSLTIISDRAFQNCTNLKTIVFGENSQLISIGANAFYGCKSLAKITIPDSVESIGNEAFCYCLSLAKVVFGKNSKLTSLGESAFYNCTILVDIILPEGITSINSNTFAYCSSLEEIIIRENVVSIAATAFRSCSSLTTVYYTGSVEAWNNLIETSNSSDLKYLNVNYNFVVIDPWDGSIATGFQSGSGTEADPYVISTGAQLAYLAHVLNTDKTNTLYNKHYVLSNDIDLGGLEWDPIGRYYADSFASGGTNQLTLMGSFNGNGYTISNFKITAFNNSARRYFGLFGYLQGPVKNLTVENARIFGERGVSRIQSAYGIIAGENRSVINGCTVYDSYIDVENKDSATIIYVGGIVGNNSAAIKNSSASVDIKAVNFDRLHIGGICGMNYNYVGNCQYQGEIEAVSKLETVYAGGIVGNNHGEVTLCSSDVNMIAEAKKSVFGGGIVGVSTEAKVTRSYAVVNVAGSGDSVNLGGIAGHNDSYSTLKECYAYGEISTENAVSTARLGGIVGYAYGTVSNNLSLAEVSMTVADGIFAYDNGVAGTGNATNCYRYEGAKVYHNGEEITLYDTSSCTADQVNSSAFYTGTLGWSASYWDLSELNYANGKLPTLINTVIP